MAVIFKVAKSHIAKKDGTLCYFPVLVKNGVMSTMQLAKMIAEKSALTVGDVFGVLLNLGSVVNQALMNSKSVQIENFGSFTLKSKSDSKPAMEDVNADCIQRLKVLFTPTKHKVNGARVADLLEGASFKNLAEMSDGLSYVPNEPDKHLKPGSLAGDAGEKPADGGHDKPATGGDDKPSTGGDDKPNTGGGDEPAGGGEGHEPVDDPFDE